MVIDVTPDDFDRVLRKLHEIFLKFFNRLPPSVRDAVRAEWQALMAAIAAARSGGIANAGTGLRSILEALKRLLVALGRVSWSAPEVRFWIQVVEARLAEAGGGAGAGAGLTAAAIALTLLALILTAMAFYEVSLALGPVDPPVGGMPCGATNPVARGLEVEEYSHWGERRAFKAAEATARAAAQTFTCPGECPQGKCRANVAITDITYRYRLFWTWCILKYDIWCECY